MPSRMNFLNAAATLFMLTLLQLDPVVMAADSGCDKPDHYRDPVVGTCKPCRDICNPIQDTMTSCEAYCPHIYCKVVCDTSKNMTAECYGKTCKVFAYENVACYPKDANRGKPSTKGEKADVPMFTTAGIGVLVGVLVGAVIVTAITFFIGGILAKDKLSGYFFPRPPLDVSQDRTYDPTRAKLLNSPPQNETANGVANGLPNGVVAPPPNAV